MNRESYDFFATPEFDDEEVVVKEETQSEDNLDTSDKESFEEQFEDKETSNESKEDNEFQEDNEEDLSELDELLKDVQVNVNDSNENNNDEIITKLEEATKLIKKLKERNSALQIENAELSRFGQDVGLSNSMIIIKSNYDKALEGDEAAISKIKQIILEDLGLEFVKPKETFFYDDIKSGVNFNSEKEEGNNGYGEFI